jgi:hypothetical protein
LSEKKDKLAKLSEAAESLGELPKDQLALLEGLTDQQKTIVRFKMRGLSQKGIANIMELTPARISQEVKAIRQHYAARGSSVDQSVLVGEAVTLYEEVEQKAWAVYQDDESKRLRALDTIMTAREKQIKLFMDLGLIKRAAIEHNHGVVVSPVLERLTPEKKSEIVARIIETAPGIEPEPPSDDDIEDAEYVDYETETEDRTSGEAQDV